MLVQRFHFLTFPMRMKLPLIMKTENNFNCGEMLKYTQSAFLKIAAQAFEAGDLLKIFFRF